MSNHISDLAEIVEQIRRVIPNCSSIIFGGSRNGGKTWEGSDWDFYITTPIEISRRVGWRVLEHKGHHLDITCNPETPDLNKLKELEGSTLNILANGRIVFPKNGSDQDIHGMQAHANCILKKTKEPCYKSINSTLKTIWGELPKECGDITIRHYLQAEAIEAITDILYCLHRKRLPQPKHVDEDLKVLDEEGYKKYLGPDNATLIGDPEYNSKLISIIEYLECKFRGVNLADANAKDRKIGIHENMARGATCGIDRVKLDLYSNIQKLRSLKPLGLKGCFICSDVTTKTLRVFYELIYKLMPGHKCDIGTCGIHQYKPMSELGEDMRLKDPNIYNAYLKVCNSDGHDRRVDAIIDMIDKVTEKFGLQYQIQGIESLATIKNQSLTIHDQ